MIFDSSIIKHAIDAEPELPGHIPDAMYVTIKDAFEREDRDLIEESYRIIARQTKDGIRKRLGL